MYAQAWIHKNSFAGGPKNIHLSSYDNIFYEILSLISHIEECNQLVFQIFIHLGNLKSSNVWQIVAWLINDWYSTTYTLV